MSGRVGTASAAGSKPAPLAIFSDFRTLLDKNGHFIEVYVHENMEFRSLSGRNGDELRSKPLADEHPITASGGSIIGCEISRNEQYPHEADLRRMRLRYCDAP